MAEAGKGNPMRDIRVEKVTLNIGVGESGQKLENAKALLTKVCGKKPMTTLAKVRSPTWRIKPGDPIGAKVTLRGGDAVGVLKRALEAVDKRLEESSFDRRGNFSFGVREYIDFPGVKYDPKIGILGFDVCVTLSRKGARVTRRRRMKARRLGAGHVVTADEARAFAARDFGVEFAEAAAK
ncbi:MAG: 50S ribosomal protein L5 [Candidatus ainarchaeum sp.]|nr:50S ribosomal protein L5 [Candidatus ainarchaeum sp.]